MQRKMFNFFSRVNVSSRMIAIFYEPRVYIG